MTPEEILAAHESTTVRRHFHGKIINSSVCSCGIGLWWGADRERDYLLHLIQVALSCTCGTRCCTIHKTHTNPHKGCILR